MYVVLLNIVFVRIPPDEGPVSFLRSLLLLILNGFQLIATFALYYRLVLPLEPGDAIASSFQVFGTVGHPANKRGDGSYLVALQIGLVFIFVAILLARFVGEAAKSGPQQGNASRKEEKKDA
jgi:hypothetical protein